MTMILLIRHAATPATGVRLVGRARGVALSDAGREQARDLVGRLADVPLAAIYSSPLERCRETAAPLAAERKLRVSIASGLEEVDYGAWTGRPLKQLARTNLWRRIQAQPSGVRFPEGESLLEAQSRALAELERIVGDHPRATVALFSHADVIKLALAHAAGLHPDLFQRLVVDLVSVSVVLAGDGMPRILRLNDTGPLARLAPKGAPRRNVGG